MHTVFISLRIMINLLNVSCFSQFIWNKLKVTSILWIVPENGSKTLPPTYFLQFHVRLKFLHLPAERGSGKRLPRKHQAPHPEQRAFLEMLSDGPQHLMRECVHACSVVWLFVTPWTVARQAPVSMEFFRQEYWSGLLFPSPGDLPNPVSLESPALAGRFFTTAPPGKPPLRERCHLSWFFFFVCL